MSDEVELGNTLEGSENPDGAEKHLKRSFTFWTALGIALCASGAWEGWTASIAQGLFGGGSVALFWGWIFVSIGIICEACALAELVSLWPSAGGQYVWVAQLAPKKYSLILSWYTAWISVAGSWLGAVSAGMGVAVQIQSYVAISRPYSMAQWQAFLICVACFVLFSVINIFFLEVIHKMNDTIIIIHLAGYVAVIITLLVCTKDKHDAHFVFLDFQNETGWDSDGIAWCVGLLTSLYAFFSLDTATHFCEEVKNASVAVPRAVVIQAALNGLMTLPFIITVLFCMGDTAAVISSQIGFTSPFTQIVYNSTHSVPAAIILNAISTYVAFAAGVDVWGAAARSIWSLARDGALPSAFAKVSPRFNVPILAIAVLCPPSAVVVMIYIWNSTAFYGVMAGVLVAFQLSYAIALTLDLFYARRKGCPRGRWSMGRWGWIVEAYALAFAVFMVIFMSFPVYQPITATNMNYSVVIISAVFVYATVLWVFYARDRYTGPTVYMDAVRVTTDASENARRLSDEVGGATPGMKTALSSGKSF